MISDVNTTDVKIYYMLEVIMQTFLICPNGDCKQVQNKKVS